MKTERYLSFRCNDEKIDEPIEVIRITRDGFYYKGEKIEDVHNIYERFNDWLKLAEKKTIK
jgi:hypothetical protein